MGTDYRTAFELAPIGLVLSRQRLMVDVNREALAMFGATRQQLIGQSFELLYPTHEEFERTGQRIVASLDARGRYADERVMKRLDGELFWCHVSGRALQPSQPHAAGVWCFEDLSARRALKVDLTPREREIAALLIDGLTSKGIGRRLTISPRTVDVYR
ncbi:MAG: PAS domain S-box protein, partial [Rubrivivax sp.]|nr:PAS domain S-box protein [Rubrivivax sp.]